MQLSRLFKVLVVGGVALVAGCFEHEDDGTQRQQPQRQPGDGDAGGDDAALATAPDGGADSGGIVLIDAGASDSDAGVSSWMHWFGPDLP
jgi:hypothetical protein